MMWERAGIAACHVGTMDRLLDKAIEYSKVREVGGQNIGKHQAISHRIANMKTRIEASRMLTYKSAWGLDNNKYNSLDASITKLYVSEALVSVAMDTLNIYGGNGYMTDYGIERTLRDAIGGTIYSGTSDIQRNIIARWLGVK
jgi:alkylation response protein AidB-like acyl-CoA dehydrogenase